MSVSYHQRLAKAGIVESTGSVGDSYDNALAENVNGSYKNELIHARRWNDVIKVEIATFEWVWWWNNERLHENLKVVPFIVVYRTSGDQLPSDG